MENIPYAAPESVLQQWPKDLPLICFLGKERFAFFATAFVPIDSNEFLNLPVLVHAEESEVPFRLGYMGICAFSGALKIVKVLQCLVFDRLRQRAYLFSDENLKETSAFILHKIIGMSKSQKLAANIELKAKTTEEEYLHACKEAIEMIRCGRFYQINLLRFFEVMTPISWNNMASLVAQRGGVQSLFWPDEGVVSFSPERFVKWRGNMMETFPIKGTIALREGIEKLRHSKKDLSELAMIVDLMRNDFLRICKPGSVQVLDFPKVLSTEHLHHLYGHVLGVLREGLTIGEVFSALYPAGSITGAPKVEVVKAIAELESQPRGYFMGSAFYWDPAQNSFDSSVLIRTLWGNEYAAGSGITLRSNPLLELKEILLKCRVLTG